MNSATLKQSLKMRGFVLYLKPHKIEKNFNERDA